jgi:MerR family transcriptional regulator, thiopeptide resistance regulator
LTQRQTLKTQSGGTVDRTYLPHEFAKRAGVTVRALHHYDRLGLLEPSGRTGAGYRVYTDRDFVRLEQIVALKFIGFPLFQIRELLRQKRSDLGAALRHQREILTEKRDHLDRAVRAIESAEQIVAAGGEHDWEPFRKVIEVIQMQTRKDWMTKYYTEEQLDNLRQRWSPEVQDESERGWAALARDVEAAIARGENPAGNTGLELAERRKVLLAMFTGGDPGIEQSLESLIADKANWAASFKKPFSDGVDNFLHQAADALTKTKS